MTGEGLRLIVPERRRLQLKTRRTACRTLTGAAALLTALLFLLPAARNGLAALLNRLMDASEAVNNYAYRRIPTVSAPDENLAGILLAGAVLCLAGSLILRARKAGGFAAALVCAGMQIYFGIALPAIWNIALFTLSGILLMDRITLRKVLCLTAAAAVLSGAAATVLPGEDEPTEKASEYLRDMLEHAAEPEAAGLPDREPDTIRETRHTNIRALTGGDREEKTQEQFRLITVEEEEISRPKWIDYLKIALLLLAAAAVIILPFIPAVALNRRRRKAREARRLFESPDRNEAICAMFRHAAKYLEKTGHGAGNMPFRRWPEAMAGKMPEKYIDSFQKCCILFEEAAYSNHEMTEAQNDRVREMLAETERLLYDGAGWRQRLRLRYSECLHE